MAEEAGGSSLGSELALQLAMLLKNNNQPQNPKLSDNLQINLKLNSQNYALWSRMIRVAISRKSKTLLNHLTENPPGKTTTEKYEIWEQEDLIVFSWLIQNIEPNLAGNLTEFSTSKELWDTLVTTYTSGKEEVHMAQSAYTKSNGSWIFDCGATDTMTYELSDFSGFSKPRKTYIQAANRGKMDVKNGGTIKISPNINLTNCLYVPSLSHKLLSISHVTKELNCSVLMHPTFCLLQDLRTGQIIGRGTESEGLYYVDEVAESGNVMLALGSSEREAWLWHRRLGRPSHMSLLPRLQELCLGFEDCKFLPEDVAQNPVRITFTFLKTLSLFDMDFSSDSMLSCAFGLFFGCTNLQTLRIAAVYKNDVPLPAIFSQEVDCSTMGQLQLRNVKLDYIKGLENEVYLMKCILACSPMLESLVIQCNSSIESHYKKYELKFELASKLLQLHRASHVAKISVFDYMYS